MFDQSDNVLDDMIEVKKKVSKFVDSTTYFIESIHKPIPFLNTTLGSDKKKTVKSPKKSFMQDTFNTKYKKNIIEVNNFEDEKKKDEIPAAVLRASVSTIQKPRIAKSIVRRSKRLKSA